MHMASYRMRDSSRENKSEPVVDDRRPVPFLDTLLGMRKHRTNADWRLVSYDEQA